METILRSVEDLLIETVKTIGVSYQHNWKVLLLAVIMAVGIKTYVNSDKLTQIMLKRKKVSIFAAVLFGAFTPLCACGTTAVMIGMLTTTVPWGTIMAFLTSSPLMSPDGFVLISGLIGVKFAIALTAASLFIGFGSGFLTNLIEKNTSFLKNQSRFQGKEPVNTCACNETVEESCSCGCAEPSSKAQRKPSNWKKRMEKLKLDVLVKELYQLGFKQILLFYTIFVGIGSLINQLVPMSIISLLFGANSVLAVPLAGIIGLPLYITTEAGIPVIKSLIESGASEGAMLTFIITGSATSAWVIAGLSTFLKKRAVMLYVGFVLVGGILSGYVYDVVNLLMR